MPVPLLILSDAVNSSTGLARISRELAIRIHSEMSDAFRVATIGAGSSGPSPDLPFQQFGVKSAVHYVPENLPDAWRLFSQGQRGAILVIMNPGWCAALANPELLPDSQLRDFLVDRPFDLWIYAPIDGDTIDGRLPQEIGDVFRGFDRVLAYTAYGASVISKTMGHTNEDMTPPFIEHLPHGIDVSTFYPRPREEARSTFVNRVAGLDSQPLREGIFMVGAIGTNTPRKDWPLVFETCSELIRRGVDLGLWVHTNTLMGHFNISSMAREHGMEGVTIASSGALSDDDLAWAYSAMECTIGLGKGEGMGYPIFESLACGTPCIHTSYAGAAEFIPESFRVQPIGFYGEGIYNVKRPLHSASDFADAIMAAKCEDAKLLPILDWNILFPEWKNWLIKGIK